MNPKKIASCDPEVMSGALVFSGTRIPVYLLIDYSETGESRERVDKPRGELFHTDWTGRGDEATSGSYEV